MSMIYIENDVVNVLKAVDLMYGSQVSMYNCDISPLIGSCREILYSPLLENDAKN